MANRKTTRHSQDQLNKMAIELATPAQREKIEHCVRHAVRSSGKHDQ